MMITEPITMLTDYAIAIEALVMALLLFRRGRGQTAIQLWGVAFAAVAVAAALGGTCHGFVLQLGDETSRSFWKAMMYALGVASFCMLAATVVSLLPHRSQRWWFVAIGLKLVVYLGWIGENNYGYAIADYLSAMAIVLLLQLRAVSGYGQASAMWIIAGVVVSFAAVGVEVAQPTLFEPLSYNDLYHLVQMVGLYLFYRGACLLKDS